MGRWSQTAGAGAVPWTRQPHMSRARVRGSVVRGHKNEEAAPAAARLPRTGGGDPTAQPPCGTGPPQMKAARGYPRTTCRHGIRSRRGRAMELPYSGGADFRRRFQRPLGAFEPSGRHGSSVFGDLDPALAHGIHHGLGAVVDRELAQDAAHVVLDRLLADRQRVGDLLVGHPLRDVVQDLHLAR